MKIVYDDDDVPTVKMMKADVRALEEARRLCRRLKQRVADTEAGDAGILIDRILDRYHSSQDDEDVEPVAMPLPTASGGECVTGITIGKED